MPETPPCSSLIKRLGFPTGQVKTSNLTSSFSGRSISEVKVRYEGRLGSTGGRFDKGVIKFRLGMGEVIDGWDQGVILWLRFFFGWKGLEVGMGVLDDEGH